MISAKALQGPFLIGTANRCLVRLHGCASPPDFCQHSGMALSYPETNATSRAVIGCAIEVHRHLGPGLLESIYEECLAVELADAGLSIQRQPPVPVVYKGRKVGGVYRPDILVNQEVIIEVKAVEKLLPVHQSQVLTYLRVTGLHVGLLFNFHTDSLTASMRRLSL